MNLHRQLLTESDCYHAGRTITPKGVMIHSTGANNPELRRYVAPNDGLLGEPSLRHWNQPGISACVHAFIGRLADGSVAAYQTLPWTCLLYTSDQYPDLKTVKDLAKYPQLFPDPEDSSKGIIYGGITGWEITEIMEKKVTAYGLDEYYNYFVSGSDAVLSASMTAAWDRQEPIVAYYWEPTWLLGMYDFVLLEDDPYDPETYQDGIGACPAVTVTVAVSNDFAASNPEFCEFLSKFSMPSATISEALAYMQDSGADYQEAAHWLLSESHPELVDEWLTAEQAETLRAAL